jgi:two-component system, chemotaxis family, protein-glutamate methylesterase/glutaminase
MGANSSDQRQGDPLALKILIVDDSLVFRKIMSEVVAELFDGADIQQAEDGRMGLERVAELEPDLVFTDIEMPNMNGLEFIKATKAAGHGCAMVVVSSVQSRTGVDHTIQSLTAGALAFVHKPIGRGFREALKELHKALLPAKGAYEAQHRSRGTASLPTPPRRENAARWRAPRQVDMKFKVVVVAVSTGGPDALMQLVPAIPADFPLPILVVQHMPATFLSSFAVSLDRKSQLTVVEAKEGMIPEAGTLYLSPGGRHLVVDGTRMPLELSLDDGPPECSVKPSADVLFRSVAGTPLRRGVLALVLTGMGEDGCRGLSVLKEGDCYSITQSEESCAVYGMPRTVDEAGLADESQPLNKIADRLIELTSKQKVGA